MKERPILFSTPMVQAILEGRKTQTRRVMKPQPFQHDSGWWIYEGFRPKARYNSGSRAANFPPNEWDMLTSPYGCISDRLWVRETFLETISTDDKIHYEYRADYSKTMADDVCWKPSIFMPREACRIMLEVTDVRVERLQDITEEDAIAEGTVRIHRYKTMVWEYETLWESINGKGSWEKNPWVWVIEFKKIEP